MIQPLFDPSRMPEINKLVSREVVRLPDGRVVERSTYDTGNVLEVQVFPGDYPNAKTVKE